MTDKNIYAPYNKFASDGFHNANHSYIMPIEHDKSELLNPSYWAFNTRSVNAGDFITVRKEDLSYVASLFVREVIPNVGVTVSVYSEKDFNQVVSSKLNIDDFVIEFNPAQKHRIISKANKTILEKGFQTKELAQEYLDKFCNGTK